MRKMLKEAELKDVANAISEEIEIREYVNGSSKDTWRKATAPEKAILYNIAYGSMLTLNESVENRSNHAAERAIISAAEFMTKLFIPECNGYDTMYLQLQTAIDEWEKE